MAKTPTIEKFQVDLKGVMEVLAKHLYSSREVFLRELMQNGVDAITARRSFEPDHLGEVSFEPDAASGVLTVTDNGIGLTEEQIRSALSRVGGSTKRDAELEAARSTLIGQFGIGMLSCFMVADEIVVLTRALGDDGPGYEWIGRSDGTYTVRALTRPIEVGTRVVLKLSEEATTFANAKSLRPLLERYGKMLRISVILRAGKYPEDITAWQCPWDTPLDGQHGANAAAALAWGWQEAGQSEIAFPIRSKACGLRGVGFLRRGGGGDTQRLHRVYIKDMFVTDQAGQLMPDWASFARCVVNSSRLKPTASRESIYEDKVFKQTKRAIEKSLMEFLHGLSENDPGLLRAVIDEHGQDFRRIAIDNNRFFDNLIDLLDFETSEGWMTLGDFRKEHDTIRVVPSGDQFRLIAPLARLRGTIVFNGGYLHHAELLHKAAERIEGMGWQPVSVRDLLGGLEPAGEDDQRLLKPIAEDLARHDFPARVQLVRFEPITVAAIYAEGTGESLARSLDAATEVADELWKEVLGGIRAGIDADELGVSLCLNAMNDAVRRLLNAGPGPLARAIVRMMYVQSLIESHQPLSPADSRIFSDAVGVVLANAAGDAR